MSSHDDLTQSLFTSLASGSGLRSARTRSGLSPNVVCWSASALSALIAGAIIAYVIVTTARRMTHYSRLRRLGDVKGSCEDVADEVREDIDYYQDPCEDFYAFACGKKDATRAEGSVFQKVQDSLSSGSLPTSGQTAIVKAHIFYRSCLEVLGVNATLKMNLETFFHVVDPTRTGLRDLSRAAEVLDLVADLSLRWGVGGVLVLSVDSSGNLVIGVHKPLLSFMTEDQLREAVGTMSDYLRLKTISLASLVQKVEATDKAFVSSFHGASPEEVVHISKVEELADGRLRLDDWINIVNAHAPQPGRHLTPNASAILRGRKAIERALRFLLSGQDAEVTRTYVLLHAVLPQMLLEVVEAGKEERKQLCVNLTRENFREIWKDIVASAVTGQQTIADVQFMATALVVTLKRLIRRSEFFRSVGSAEATLKKLDLIRFNFPAIRSDYTLTNLLSGLPKLSVGNFYANLLETHRFLAVHAGQDKHGDAPEVPHVTYRSDVIDISAASVSTPYVCYRSPIVLNYATIGLDIAEELMNAVDSLFAGADGNNTLVKFKDLYPCAAKLLKKLGEYNLTREMLREVIRLRGAFQLASEATKLELKRSSRDPVLPAVIQTFVARYCNKLCNASLPGSLTASVRCNAAVMANDQFLRFFGCETGQRMAPERRCTVF